MKTTISIPDELFTLAEITAKKLGIPRSQLFARALEEFIENHSNQSITEKLNKVIHKHYPEIKQADAKIQEIPQRIEKKYLEIQQMLENAMAAIETEINQKNSSSQMPSKELLMDTINQKYRNLLNIRNVLEKAYKWIDEDNEKKESRPRE